MYKKQASSGKRSRGHDLERASGDGGQAPKRRKGTKFDRRGQIVPVQGHVPSIRLPLSAASMVSTVASTGAGPATPPPTVVHNLEETFSAAAAETGDSGAPQEKGPKALRGALRRLKRISIESPHTDISNNGVPIQLEGSMPSAARTPRTNPPRVSRPQEFKGKLDPSVEDALRYLGVTFGRHPGKRRLDRGWRKERRARRWRRFCQQRALWPTQRWYLGFTERLAHIAKGRVRQLATMDRWRVEQLQHFGMDHLADAALGRLSLSTSAHVKGTANSACEGDMELLQRGAVLGREDAQIVETGGRLERMRGEDLESSQDPWLHTIDGAEGERHTDSEGDASSEHWGAPVDDGSDEWGSHNEFGDLACLDDLERGEDMEIASQLSEGGDNAVVCEDFAEHLAALRAMRMMARDDSVVEGVHGGGGVLQVFEDSQEEDPGGAEFPERSHGAADDGPAETDDKGGESKHKGATEVPSMQLGDLLDDLVLEPVVYTPASCRLLSEAESAAVDAVFQPGTYSASDEVASLGTQVVTAQELTALKGTCWLNDQVVNFYMDLILRRNQAKRQGGRRAIPRVHVLNSFFYTRLLLSGVYDYGGVRRWTKKVNVFEHDIILTPINLSNTHWALISMNMTGRCVEYYDSLSGPVEGARARTITQTVLRYLEDESRDKLRRELDHRHEWTVKQMLQGVPRQDDGSSCGVFVCAYADLLAQGARLPFAFSQADIPTIRRAMAADILAQKIGPA